MSTSTYRYLEPLHPERRPYTVEGHIITDGIHTYLFHLGPPVTAIGGCEDVGPGWHCYHTICGREGDVYRDMAETEINVNAAEPRFTA